MTTGTALAAVLIVVGLVGVVVPLLPGLLLVWGGVAVWAFGLGRAGGWVVLGVATVIVLVGSVAKYLLPGRRMRDAGVPGTTIMIGAAAGVVAFFVIPVVGLPIGFIGGVYLTEFARLGAEQAWPSTKHALAAVGWSILIELTAGLLVTAVWAAGLLTT